MSVSTLVDPADVATVQALEPQVKALIAAWKDATPALERLIEAEYPGAAALGFQLRDALQEKPVFDGSIADIAMHLREMIAGAGDQAALDYYQLCVEGGLTIADAARSILGSGGEASTDDEHLDQIEALRRYAAKVSA